MTRPALDRTGRVSAGVVCGVLLLLCGLESPLHADDRIPEIRVDRSPRALCDRTDLVAAGRLTPARVDSIARSFSDLNYRMVGLADSLLQSGRFGPPDSDSAREQARGFVQIRSQTAMHYLLTLGEDTERLTWVDGCEAMQPAGDFYRNVAVYPLQLIEGAIVGESRFCVRFEIPGDYEHRLDFGGLTVKMKSESVDLRDREKVPVISREHIASRGQKIEMLFTDTFCGNVGLERIVDRGDTLNLLTISRIDGLHVRKGGIHQMRAIAMWWNDVEDWDTPETLRLGAVAYFPRIKFTLPWFLPDLGLADLRDFVYPPPILSARYFGRLAENFPSWIRPLASGQFDDWDAVGPRPEIVEERFPDL